MPGLRVLIPTVWPMKKVKWETSEQYNVGIDARFLNGRLALTADSYIKNTKD